jgi:hypothetical protein
MRAAIALPHIFIFLIGSYLTLPALAAEDIGAGLTGVTRSTAEWGDYDNDGDLDILLSGYTGGRRVAYLYRNNAGTFVNTYPALPGLIDGAVAWGDYDNDGDLDFAMLGLQGPITLTTSIYRNDYGEFVIADSRPPGVTRGSLAWGDYDKDGDLDLLMTGETGATRLSRIYQNTQTGFMDLGASLPGVVDGSCDWGDYDDDGDLDILLTGLSDSGQISRVYENQGGEFLDASAGLTGVSDGSAVWGDYDNDGDLDIALAGHTGTARVSRVYRNDAGAFISVAPGFPGIDESTLAWGDYDNDGFRDILFAGLSDAGPVSAVYRYDGGSFVDAGAGLVGTSDGEVAWGDYDNDGDLDILQTGSNGSAAVSTVYRNDAVTANTPPTTPTALRVSFEGATVNLQWDESMDSQTAPAGLTYNIRVGTAPGASDIASAMADPSTGYRRVVRLGNANHGNGWRLRLPRSGTYFWTVQAIDAAHAGSAFAVEQHFDLDAVTFLDIDAGLTKANSSAAVWGDYNNDGFLDVLLAGESSSGPIAHVYRNIAGSFSNVRAGLPGVSRGSAAWGDYDNDGDLDLFLMGDTGATRISRIYRYDSGTFVDIGAGLTGADDGSAAWADYDNDGDLDLLLTGETGAGAVTTLYRNDDGNFEDSVAGLPAVSSSAVAWGDFDNDGDMDMLLAGDTGTTTIARIYRNDAGVFFDMGAGLPGVRACSVAWGDTDNDGDLDILLSGDPGGAPITRIFLNDAGVFTDMGAGLTGVQDGSVAWGDFGNDGDLDILLTGHDGSEPVSLVYSNSGVDFELFAGLTGVTGGSGAWGDFDNDGGLDLVITGDSESSRISSIYENTILRANSRPLPPSNLGVTLFGTVATFTWDAGFDSETPSPGLTYNLRVGSTPGDLDIVSPMANPATGARRVAQLGNTNHSRSWSVVLPGGGTFYWGVQSIDAGFSGSVFTLEQSFGMASIDDIDAGLEGVGGSAVSWGDFDQDGDLDAMIAGLSGGGPLSRLYRNDDGAFVDAGAGFIGVSQSSLEWGDYDNDGDLDLLLAGDTGSGETSRVYRNDSGVFSDVTAGLTGVKAGSVAWGDYDNDGDLDALISGETGSGNISLLYQNDAGIFTDAGAALPGVANGSVAWGDYDSDGELDVLISGETGSGPIARIYRNDAGVFADAAVGFPGVSESDAAWGDYDNDGDLDVLLTGNTGSSRLSRVYRNENGSYVDSESGLPGLSDGSIAWGDTDNDGDLDALLTGDTGTERISRIYRNDAGSFVDVGAAMVGVSDGAVAVGDYDADGNLDILLAGETGAGPVSKIYRITNPAANSPPGIPYNLSVSMAGHEATFHWIPPFDGQTPNTGLTHNLRVGTTPGGSEILSAMANPGSGKRYVARMGSTNHTLSWPITLPSGGDYYWTVQAVDPSFAGSAFSAERMFRLVSFSDIGAGLSGIKNSSVAWGDYDNDGDLDLLTAGSANGGPISRVYGNDGGNFSDVGAALPGVSHGASVWGDYDGDGDLDFVLAGRTSSGAISRVYRNEPAGFSDIGAGLLGLDLCAAAWGDYDNDGDLDLLMAGEGNQGPVTVLYENDGGTFASTNNGIDGVRSGALAWGDYDNDGDLDFLLAGQTSQTAVSQVHRNDGGSFSKAFDLPGLAYSSAAWGDYNADGYLDIVMSGEAGSVPKTRLYWNNGGFGFIASAVVLPEVAAASVAWGDHDNDGDLDILISGALISTETVLRVQANDNGDFADFADLDAALPGVDSSAVAWGDYDNDGDLDAIVTGNTDGGPVARVYRNQSPVLNTPPEAPANLSFVLAGLTARLSWDAASDAETPTEALTYNLRIGSTTGGSEIVPSMADAGSGYRRVVQLGNVNHNTDWRIDLPLLPAFSLAVQSEDAAFAGSPFSSEIRILLAPAIVSVEDIPDDEGGWVRLRVTRSDLDDGSQSEFPIATYNVWQRVDDAATAARVWEVGKRAGSSPGFLSPAGTVEWGGRRFARGRDLRLAAEGSLPPGTWEIVGSFASAQQGEYVIRASTLRDSTAAGTAWSVYVVSAHTTSPTVWFASEPDSGYSKDDLAPAAPEGFTVAGVSDENDVELSWLGSGARDFHSFHLYRDTQPAFVPGPENLLAQPTGNSYTDPGALNQAPALFYQLTAVDSSGNEGEPAHATTQVVAAGSPDIPKFFSLHAVAPNPISKEAIIRFDLPTQTAVQIHVYDARGRLVLSALEGEQFPAGRHQWVWDGRSRSGNRVPPGIYFYRLIAGSFTATRKAVLME